MEYLKLYEEFFTPEEKKEAEYIRRKAKRYPMKRWEMPEIQITITPDIETGIRQEWDQIKKEFVNYPLIKKQVENVFKNRGLSIDMIDLDGSMLPIQAIQVIYEELFVKPQQKMQQIKGQLPGNVEPVKQRRQLGFRVSNKSNDIGSENE